MAVGIGNVGQRVHVHAVVATQRAQQVDIAGALVSEPEVFAYQQPAYLQTFDQELFDEVLSGHFSHLAVKPGHGDLSHACIGQRSQLIAQGGDLGGTKLGSGGESGKLLTRVGREGQHRRRQPQGLRGGANGLQHGLVAAVDTVKIAD